MDFNSRVTGAAAKLAERESEARAVADDVFERVATTGPLRDMWRMTMWSNCYCEPIFAEMAQTYDVGRDEFNVLSCMAAYGSMLAKNVCDVTGRPKNSISRAVNSLVARKLIRRKTNANDRRESLLILNESGRRLYERVLPVALDRQTLMLKALNDEERALLDGLLGKMMSVRNEW